MTSPLPAFPISRLHDFTTSRLHDFTISRFHDFTIYDLTILTLRNFSSRKEAAERAPRGFSRGDSHGISLGNGLRGDG